METPAALEQISPSALLDAAPDGVVVVDERGRLVLVNRRMGELFGYPPADLLGRPVEGLIPDARVELHRGGRANSGPEPRLRSMGAGPGLRGLRRDGTTFPVEISLGPLRLGDRLHVIATVRDVTERQAREAGWRTVAGIVLAAPDAVWAFDRETLKLTFVNNGAVRQLGYSRQELLAMTPADVTPSMPEPAYREIIDGLVPGTSSTYRTVHRRKDGTGLMVETTLFDPAAGVDRAPSQWLASIARDLSGRIESEPRAVVAERELAVAEDRRRIASDLHTRVIQRLFVAGLAASSLAARLHDAPARERLRQMVADLDEVITDLRSSIFGLTPASGVSLRRQIVELVDTYAEPLAFVPAVRFEGPVDTVSPELSADLLATLREVLATMSRHGAFTVVVTVTVGEGIAISVEDCGTGLPLEGRRDLDLDAMASRAAALGGSLVADASSLGGARLLWRVPWTGLRPS